MALTKQLIQQEMYKGVGPSGLMESKKDREWSSMCWLQQRYILSAYYYFKMFRNSKKALNMDGYNKKLCDSCGSLTKLTVKDLGNSEIGFDEKNWWIIKNCCLNNTPKVTMIKPKVMNISLR